LVTHAKKITFTDSAREQCAEEIIWPYREKVTGEQRKLHHKGLYDLYSSPDSFTLIKWRRMSREEHLVQNGRD
jgi:hypothetical protein